MCKGRSFQAFGALKQISLIFLEGLAVLDDLKDLFGTYSDNHSE